MWGCVCVCAWVRVRGGACVGVCVAAAGGRCREVRGADRHFEPSPRLRAGAATRTARLGLRGEREQPLPLACLSAPASRGFRALFSWQKCGTQVKAEKGGLFL